MQNKYSGMKTIYTLQIFRGLAALLVVLGHAQLYVSMDSPFKVWESGLSGVAFFFVLSGFIITYTNYQNIGKGTHHQAYMVKRLMRIYPIYWVYTLATLLLGYLCYLRFGQKIMIDNSLTAVDYLKSFSLFPYSRVGDQWPIINPAWTLSYEMLFYLAFFAVMRWPVSRVFPFVATWFAMILLFQFGMLAKPDAFLVSFLFNAHILQFFMGCAIAYVVVQKNSVIHRRQLGVVMFFAGLALLTTVWKGQHLPWLGGILRFGIPYSLIIFGAAIVETTASLRFMQSKAGAFLIYMGEASYSIYLVHYWILYLCAVILAAKVGNEAVIFWGSSIFALAAGIGAYRYVEAPLLRTLKKWVMQNGKQAVLKNAG